MKKCLLFLMVLVFAFIPFLLAEEEPADSQKETSPAQPKSNPSAVRQFASGVKQVAYEGPKDFTKETIGEIPKRPTIERVVEGVNTGTKKLLDHTVKGAYKVATLGQSELESYEIEEPKKGSDETTKIKISIPGT